MSEMPAPWPFSPEERELIARQDEMVREWCNAARDESGEYAGRGIYVASRSHHGEMWKECRAAGAPIVSTWIDECGQGETSDWSDLWRRCIDEATSSACVVLYAPILDGELKGALIETGAALAAGRRVFVVADVEARRYSWTAHPLVTVCESIAEAMELAEAHATSRSLATEPAGDVLTEEERKEPQ